MRLDLTDTGYHNGRTNHCNRDRTNCYEIDEPNMDEKNPVVMLAGRVWHIVESGRSARVGLCGRELRDQKAHSRLRAVGRENVCANCLKVLDGNTTVETKV